MMGDNKVSRGTKARFDNTALTQLTGVMNGGARSMLYTCEGFIPVSQGGAKTHSVTIHWDDLVTRSCKKITLPNAISTDLDDIVEGCGEHTLTYIHDPHRLDDVLREKYDYKTITFLDDPTPRTSEPAVLVMEDVEITRLRQRDTFVAMLIDLPKLKGNDSDDSDDYEDEDMVGDY